MHARHRVIEPPPAPTSFVLDHCWPEYASFVAGSRRPEDQLLAPGFWKFSPGRYNWPGDVSRAAGRAMLKRHLGMRRVARAPGYERQSAYLRNDRAVARALAAAIDYRCGHLIVAQNWLTWLDEAGALGGRTFDVLMNRYPMAEIHRMLDDAAGELGDSITIRDFRAPLELVERETKLLERARQIITPHHGVADLVGEKSVRLAWHRSTPGYLRTGSRVAFLGPTIARQRPDIVRRLCAGLSEPLIVFGDVLEQPCWWDGIPIERRRLAPGWLDDIGAILHPAVMTNEPRRLLEASAAGVRIYATGSCGLAPDDYLRIEEFSGGPLQAPTP